MTIGKFYRVTGESTQHRGVEPDVALPSQIDMEEFGESALEGALPWDRIPGVPFRSEGKSQQPNIAVLATEEKTRADRDPDYRWLVADLAAADVMRKQTSLSLNLQQRKDERERLERERLTRENARRAAQNLPPLKNFRGAGGRQIPGHRARSGHRSHDRHGHWCAPAFIRRRRAPCAARPKRPAEASTAQPLRTKWCCS